MRSFGRTYRDRLAVAAALGLPVAIAAVLLPWRGSLPNTDVALVLVAAVVAVAANGHRGAGVLTAAGCALWFDFFWTQPYERFTITRGSWIKSGTVQSLFITQVFSSAEASSSSTAAASAGCR